MKFIKGRLEIGENVHTHDRFEMTDFITKLLKGQQEETFILSDFKIRK